MGVVALLDTHAVLWAAAAPDRLGPAARATIEDPATQLLVSAATAWELSTKARLGRFPEAEPIVAAFGSIVDELGADHLPITSAHALRAGALPWAHRDPFDRMLASQALIEHAVLVTRDRAFDVVLGIELRW